MSLDTAKHGRLIDARTCTDIEHCLVLCLPTPFSEVGTNKVDAILREDLGSIAEVDIGCRVAQFPS